MQDFLLRQLFVSAEDKLFEYCISQIKKTHGRISIKELEKKTGYGSRWLNMKFTDKLGVSPKNFASIVRFNHFYHYFISHSEKPVLKSELYDLYYDQSHFIKDFKRFTGYPPSTLENRMNEFGERYFKV